MARAGGYACDLDGAELAAVALDAAPLSVEVGVNAGAAEIDAAIGAPASASGAPPSAGSGALS
jgi:hypothetical protein